MFAILIFLSGLLQTVSDPNKFNGFMILGYVIMWLVAMVYIFIMANRQRNAREELKLMEQLLREDKDSDLR